MVVSPLAGAVCAELAAGACFGAGDRGDSWRSGRLQEADQGRGGRGRERPLAHGRCCGPGLSGDHHRQVRQSVCLIIRVYLD